MDASELQAAHSKIRERIRALHPIPKDKGWLLSVQAQTRRAAAFYSSVMAAGLPMPSSYCSELEERWEEAERVAEHTIHHIDYLWHVADVSECH